MVDWFTHFLQKSSISQISRGKASRIQLLISPRISTRLLKKFPEQIFQDAVQKFLPWTFLGCSEKFLQKMLQIILVHSNATTFNNFHRDYFENICGDDPRISCRDFLYILYLRCPIPKRAYSDRFSVYSSVTLGEDS